MSWKPNALLNYLMVIFFEESLFRVLVLGSLMLIFCNWIAVIIASVIFGAMHFVKYNLKMVVSAFILGIGLGWLFIWIIFPLNFLVCVVVHLGIGSLGVYLGCMRKWIR